MRVRTSDRSLCVDTHDRAGRERIAMRGIFKRHTRGVQNENNVFTLEPITSVSIANARDVRDKYVKNGVKW